MSANATDDEPPTPLTIMSLPIYLRVKIIGFVIGNNMLHIHTCIGLPLETDHREHEHLVAVSPLPTNPMILELKTSFTPSPGNVNHPLCYHYPRAPKNRFSAAALLVVNRPFYTETTRVLYGTNVFSFNALTTLKNFLCNIGPRELDYLTSICISDTYLPIRYTSPFDFRSIFNLNLTSLDTIWIHQSQPHRDPDSRQRLDELAEQDLRKVEWFIKNVLRRVETQVQITSIPVWLELEKPKDTDGEEEEAPSNSAVDDVTETGEMVEPEDTDGEAEGSSTSAVDDMTEVGEMKEQVGRKLNGALLPLRFRHAGANAGSVGGHAGSE